jgi:hypothetical protein
MLSCPEIWSILKRWMPKGSWVDLQDLYHIVEDHASLRNDDFEPDAPGSTGLRWQRNVRNALQAHKRQGDIAWDGNAHYRL